MIVIYLYIFLVLLLLLFLALVKISLGGCWPMMPFHKVCQNQNAKNQS